MLSHHTIVHVFFYQFLLCCISQESGYTRNYIGNSLCAIFTVHLLRVARILYSCVLLLQDIGVFFLRCNVCDDAEAHVGISFEIPAETKESMIAKFADIVVREMKIEGLQVKNVTKENKDDFAAWLSHLQQIV